MSSSIEFMAQEIASQADLFESSADDIMAQCKAIMSKHNFSSKINRVYITGCGDSYFAGIACHDIFMKYTKIHTEVYQALEFSRYLCDYEVDEHCLVLAVSSSGSVARTAECVLRAAQKGALSVAVTSNTKSRLAQVSPEQVIVNIPESVGFAPGTQSYFASLIALICIALALGEQLGTIDENKSKEIVQYIYEIGKAMKKTVDVCDVLAKKYIKAYGSDEGPQKIKMFHVLGSGPNWGTAQFGTMKLLEAAGFDSVPQGIEEWAHSQYFTTRPGTHTLIVAPKGESRERALEIMQAITVMDGKKIVIGEEDDEELARWADIYFPICGISNMIEEFTPLIYQIPIELIALHLCEIQSVPSFEFEAKPWRKIENFRQIFGSKIVTFSEAKDRSIHN